MPLCPTCDNRPFATKEALLQHVRTSSNPHPFCLACDRRFSSELAYNAHMAAKHPPTFDCLKCGKQYSSQFALEGHYRGHTDHPNCPVCGKGFYDNAALTAHIGDTHNDLWCSTCNLRFESVATANEHYTTSPVHPKCGHCGVGFRDGDVLEKHTRSHEPNAPYCKTTSPTVSTSGELETPTLRSSTFTSPTSLVQSPPASVISSAVFPLHPSAASQSKESLPLQPTAVHGFVSSPPLGFIGAGTQLARNGNGSTASFGGTGFSPLSPKPNIFHKDLRRVSAIDTTLRVDSPDISQMMNVQSSPLLNVQAPAFSPVGLPKPGKQIDELWSSRENIQVTRGRPPRQHSFQNPPWNATPLGSAIPNTATSQQLVPFSPYRFQPMPPRHRASSDFGDGATPTATNFPPLIGANPDTSSIPESRTGGAARTEYNFNPRLYPGSVRHAAQGVSSTSGPQPIGPAHRNTLPAPTQMPNFNHINPSFDSGFRQHPPSLLSLPLPFSPPKRQNSALRILPPPPTSPEGQEEERTPNTRGSHYANDIEEKKPRKGSFHDEVSMLSAVSTPRFASDAPLHDFVVKPGTSASPNGDELLPSPSDFSTDFSTISSVSSSVVQIPSPTPIGRRKREFSRSRSRAASSARSDISSLSIPTYKITESSRRASPISPDVISPVGLAALPAISPLGPSPIDLDASFDIPEARHPLPESLPPSPLTAQEPQVKEHEEQDPPNLTSASNSRSESVLGIRQDEGVLLAPANGGATGSFFESRIELLSSPSSPRSFVTSPEEEVPSIDADVDRFRSISRAASMRSVSPQGETKKEDQQIDPDPTVKSPSPTPSPVPPTPKADEDTFLLPTEGSSPADLKLSPGPSKQRRLVAPSLGVTPNISIASTSYASEGIGGAGSSSSMPSLHCRACRRETPDDITATMCGHVFCNRCIVDAVIKTSRCPFCSTPTLLYCLFRLDLAT
ncbi:hypothetical protein P691DRAFT_35477 [Macrolepiota fuliginosa MF-IS2]|uniref:RING-type domain-containing protein n=1 Tax=Macrolepiota fuliginosa MF-IS2 TaxID=1400762 RepID=A0A9P6C281_9AGAR|nr:hypothetical protein P691DRAFT_35477 [Macrolepiota fuliginosa MF-IS2]